MYFQPCHLFRLQSTMFGEMGTCLDIVFCNIPGFLCFLFFFFEKNYFYNAAALLVVGICVDMNMFDRNMGKNILQHI